MLFYASSTVISGTDPFWRQDHGPPNSWCPPAGFIKPFPFSSPANRRKQQELPIAVYESFQPLFSPELSLWKRICTLLVWVSMRPGDFSPQKGPNSFCPALICQGKNEGVI